MTATDPELIDPGADVPPSVDAAVRRALQPSRLERFRRDWPPLPDKLAQLLASNGGSELIRVSALLLPAGLREEWLEEHRGYLRDLPTRRARWRWSLSQFIAMPRYAYTVRTGRKKEGA